MSLTMQYFKGLKKINCKINWLNVYLEHNKYEFFAQVHTHSHTLTHKRINTHRFDTITAVHTKNALPCKWHAVNCNICWY